ncbi:alpha/beta-hydrolase [Coniochaeta ligniaria NRRL 30616]|uniref:Alpha/beta-hydrolase n=1 Tax=Coniochaeta ligniaria NRRL 30616 TaxID=1408157 RepID=A0A1J7I7V6_9PEZI|nr:alpha/beta-hydrolase [Coniochaeta ligniaria NRRL 30616]
MDAHRITLASKPGASLAAYTYTPRASAELPSPLGKTLVVFLNGLVSPQSSWKATIDLLLQNDQQYLPALLTYDRYGQGESDPDPTDPPNTPYGHDATAVVEDLYQLLGQVCSDVLHLRAPGESSNTRLVFVCNSIGCVQARLYAVAHPGTVCGFLFLDSMMANSDFVSVFPDPDAADFDPSKLPQGVSIEEIRYSREQYRKFFHPTVPNPERFDRRDMQQRLPFADKPLLPAGPDGSHPLLTVVGHDFDRFAQDGLEGFMAIPKAVTNAYMNPVWHAYNQGLTRLTGRKDAPTEPIIVGGCGHVIQKDSPSFVANQIHILLDRLCADIASV